MDIRTDNLWLMQGKMEEKIQLLLNKGNIVVITDPPYGILGGSKSIGGSKSYKVNEYNCDWDKTVFNKNQLSLIQGVSKHQVLFGYNYYPHLLPSTNSLIIWDKKEKNNWNDNFSDGEIAWTSYKKPLRIFRHLWMGALRKGTRIKRQHPTQKPVELMEYILENYTNPTDIILDPFMDSGSTGVACMNTGRTFIGIELDPKYYGIACERILNANT